MEKIKKRVRLDEIGLYIRTINQDYKVKSHQEMADLITEHFNVICLEEDVKYYEELEFYHREMQNAIIQNEDHELESRKHNYFLRTGFIY